MSASLHLSDQGPSKVYSCFCIPSPGPQRVSESPPCRARSQLYHGNGPGSELPVNLTRTFAQVRRRAQAQAYRHSSGRTGLFDKCSAATVLVQHPSLPVHEHHLLVQPFPAIVISREGARAIMNRFRVKSSPRHWHVRSSGTLVPY